MNFLRRLFKKNTNSFEEQPTQSAPLQSMNKSNSLLSEKPKGITILGKKYQLLVPIIRMPGESLQVGAILNCGFFECRIPRRRDGGQVQVCGTKLGIVADFVPSAWMCPICGGLTILYTKQGIEHYLQPDVVFNLTDEITAFCYSAERIQGSNQTRFFRWLDKLIGGQSILNASASEDSFMESMIDSSKVVAVEPTFIPVDQLEKYQDATASKHTLLAEARLSQGAEYFKQGRFHDAVNEIQEALRINPNSAHAHYNLGIAYGALDRTGDAIAEYKAAIRINPDMAEAHYSLGSIYGPQGQISEALREFQEALRITPDDSEIHANLGMVYGMQGRVNDEIREYQTAIQLNPNLAMPHYNLGITYVQQGRMNDGISELKIAERLGHPMASQALAKFGRGY